MRALVVFCHPCAESFIAAVKETAVAALRAAGHEVEVADLYAEGFEPAMSAEERRQYHDPALNELPVRREIERLKWAKALVFVYPTWWYGPPAMLKGWLDRVFVPHVAFTMPVGHQAIGRGLTNIRHIVAISTLGSPWWWWRFMGQPGRRILLSGLRAICSPRCRTHWLGLHRMDSATPAMRERFLGRVKRLVAQLG